MRAAAAAAAASPTGTPQSNAPRDGKGTALDLPFGHRAVAAARAGDASAAPRRLTQAEWRKAYIARHGHDLQPALHPGH